ncbi:hypothetical protein BDY21DRAFT_357636 [Lineolata rhizophorae]|uniref:Aminoglycoside phosphotransferase domain-containing protein n=1 Tax=Lineolata rhizophorae TaxID=578093 RepID=A0A6A6NMN4_9PEZI|nr:hypothetical protein BDY21DRAFT_357636 [Lineolata rhizophorae]
MTGVSGGPFESEEQFNTWQLSHLLPNLPLSRRDLYQTMHKTYYKIVFAHGDLGFQNVLVKDGHITALIDWEDASWFPEHWDYCKTAGYLTGSDELYLALKKIFDKQYFEEYLMDLWFTREVQHGGF